MLKTFEDLTPDLKEEDENLAREIAVGLNKLVGKDKAVSNKRIRQIYWNKYRTRIGDIRMRKMIQFIRIHNLAPRLCSNSNGYYIAETDQEWEDWKISMGQRIRQMIFTMVSAMAANDKDEATQKLIDQLCELMTTIKYFGPVEETL